VILVLGGTSDARAAARTLKEAGQEVQITAVTEYGAPMGLSDVDILEGQLDASRLSELLTGAHALVDATHPFATRTSRLAIQVCAEKGIPYVRYERPWTPLPPMADVVMASGVEKGAVYAVELAEGGTIYATIGSEGLGTFYAATRAAGCRTFVRVLPESGTLAECERIGIKPWDLLALQGPTSIALETELLRRVDARVIVTREDGAGGAILDKLKAARSLGIPVIVVSRPRMEYPRLAGNQMDLIAVVNEVAPLSD